jgi:1-deoxy-D-xylulose-5-phosphate reductoisomerase
MAAIVGTAGLAPTLAAAKRGANIALANKECLVSAGDLFIGAVANGGGRLLPVDSEHNAIFQVLEEGQRHALERIILTASGGPFRTWTREAMANVTAATARAHPNWSMGLKISIDSASMFNKALEMIETREYFGIDPDRIEVLLHPESLVHALVGFRDGGVIAHLGMPDMRHAIGYALNWPERAHLPVGRLDLARAGSLTFRAPDPVHYPALRLAREVMAAGGLCGSAFNAAKEAALDAFIAGRIGFTVMAEVVEAVLERLSGAGALGMAPGDLDMVLTADAEARRVAGEIISLRQGS